MIGGLNATSIRVDFPTWKDFITKVKAEQQLPKDKPLFLIMGSSLEDKTRHPNRSLLYERDDIFHMSNEGVDLKILGSMPLFLHADFNDSMTLTILSRFLKERFSAIYFDWSTFKLFSTNRVSTLNNMLRVGGQVYIPEPESTLYPDINKRLTLLPYASPEETVEQWNIRWTAFKKEWSKEAIKELFQHYDFHIEIVRSDEIHDPIFEEIKRNKHYMEHPGPFNVLIATKVKDYRPSESA